LSHDSTTRGLVRECVLKPAPQLVFRIAREKCGWYNECNRDALAAKSIGRPACESLAGNRLPHSADECSAQGVKQ
jgi:hypothetical protein